MAYQEESAGARSLLIEPHVAERQRDLEALKQSHLQLRYAVVDRAERPRLGRGG